MSHLHFVVLLIMYRTHVVGRSRRRRNQNPSRLSGVCPGVCTSNNPRKRSSSHLYSSPGLAPDWELRDPNPGTSIHWTPIMFSCLNVYVKSTNQLLGHLQKRHRSSGERRKYSKCDGLSYDVYVVRFDLFSSFFPSLLPCFPTSVPLSFLPLLM